MTTTQAPEARNNECLCGCGAAVRNRFAQGHDARFKGQLLSAAKAGDASAVERMITEGWTRFLPEHLVPEVTFRFANRARNGRFARTLHIDGLGFGADGGFDQFWTDSEQSHSHPTCPDVKGVTRSESEASEWLCSTCIHVAHDTVWAAA
jgi:hypothetical protein